MGSKGEKHERVATKLAIDELTQAAFEKGQKDKDAGVEDRSLKDLKANLAKEFAKGGKAYKAFWELYQEGLELARKAGASPADLKALRKKLERDFLKNIHASRWQDISSAYKEGLYAAKGKARKHVTFTGKGDTQHPTEIVFSLKPASKIKLTKAPYIRKGESTGVGKLVVNMVKKLGLVKAKKGRKVTLIDVQNTMKSLSDELKGETMTVRKDKAGKPVRRLAITQAKSGKAKRDKLKQYNEINRVIDFAKAFTTTKEGKLTSIKGGVAAHVERRHKKGKKGGRRK